MKKTINILTIIFSILAFSCQAQEQNKPKFDKIPFDVSKGNISQISLKFDINGDGLKDILLEFIYRNFEIDIPKGSSGHELAIYLNKGNNNYELTKVNKAILWLIHSSVFEVNSKTFCVVNEDGGQDPNNYYTYFQYDNERENWLLIKHEIFTNNTGQKVIIEQKTYTETERVPFEIASFDELFGKIHSEAPDLPNFKLIRVKKSIIHSQPNQPSKMYLIKDDYIEILEKRDCWLRISFYNDKTKKEIEGWIKKSDVEDN